MEESKFFYIDKLFSARKVELKKITTQVVTSKIFAITRN
jgi:hypothetical protein